jgi:hypothetical protein
MVLGSVWCSDNKVKEINKRIREIKQKYGLSDNYELKWTKISKNHYKLYLDVIDYFFDDDDLHFRGVIVPDKSMLKHEEFQQSHDLWYYKMFFILFKTILDPQSTYRIYLDYKDNQGGARIRKLRDVLCNNYYDFSREIITNIQLVKSDQVELIQITDVLTGALSYLHRGLISNLGKNVIIDRIKERSGYTLMNNTLYREKKVNLLIWRPLRMALDD